MHPIDFISCTAQGLSLNCYPSVAMAAVAMISEGGERGCDQASNRLGLRVMAAHCVSRLDIGPASERYSYGGGGECW